MVASMLLTREKRAMSRSSMFLLGWVLGLAWLTLTRLHAENGPSRVSAETLDWSRVAREGNAEARCRAIGKRVKRIRLNMTRHQVEQIIGEPDHYYVTEFDLSWATYVYEPGEGEPFALLGVCYNARNHPLRVVEIKERVPRD